MKSGLKKCFFITPMGAKNSETDNNSKEIIQSLNKIFSENDVFIKVQRTNQYSHVGVITENIHNQIKEADLIIADLTDNNPNVAYELGYANAFNKPIIQICSENNFQLASDYKHIYTIDYDLNDEHSKFLFEQNLLKTVKAMNFNPDYTPISPSLGFQFVDEVED